MKKVGGGRPKDADVRRHVEELEEGRRWKCKYCELEFAGGATRIRAHINGGGGIQVCQKFVSDKGNSNDLRDNLQHCRQDYSMPNEAGQSQADAKYQEGIRVFGSSSVSDGENGDLKVIQYVFECLSPEDKVFHSPLSYLSQEEFATLRPGAFLDSLVIDVFAEMLTHIERKKITPSNWYLPVTFSEAALKSSIGRFLDFVDRQKIRENYMSDLKSCEKIFIPVHIGAKSDGGHFYLYVIHLKNKEIEVWDSLLNTLVAETERDETTKKLLLAMEKLFVKVAFTEFRSKMETDILLCPNGFDCGVFVMKFMEQSDNYVRRNPSFQFDSEKERGDLAVKLLNSDQNQEKQNLHDKARRHYAQVEKQDGNNRSYNRDPSDVLFDEDDIIDHSKKKVVLENMALGNEKVILPVDMKELVMKNCRQGTGARSLCSVLSYGHNNNPLRIELLDVSDYEDAEYLCCCSCLFCSCSQLVGRLHLRGLKDLKNFISPFTDSLHQSTLFSHLADLEIWECNSMKTLMPLKLLAILQNLRTISVNSCEKLKEIVGEEHSVMELTGSGDLMVLPHDSFSHPTIELPKLTSLTLHNMLQLDFVYRGIMLCPSLKEFSANQCERLSHPRIANSNNGSVLLMQKTPHGCYWKK